MKKMQVICILTGLMIILSACGGENNEGGNENAQNTNGAAEAVEESPDEGSGKVEIVTLNWGSYIGEELEEQGVHGAIIKAAFDKAGLDYEITFTPWKRAYNTALEGEAFLVSASHNEERAQIFHYSEPYDNAATVLIGLKSDDHSYYDGTVESLKGKKVGILRAHYVVKFFTNKGHKNVEEVNDDTANLKKLLNGRVDLVAMSKVPAVALLKDAQELKGGLEKITFLDPPIRDNPIHLIAHKEKVGNAEEVIAKFNKGLAGIKEDGSYLEIKKRFGLVR